MKHGVRIFTRACAVAALACVAATAVQAQPLSLSKEEMVQYTPGWTGERFPDGRPKVSDDIIARMKYVSITEAWAYLNTARDASAGGGGARGMGGYTNQYWGDPLVRMREDVTVCGRVMTAHFMPSRPDVNGAIQAQGTKDQRKSSGQYTWGIDNLQKGDVYVADVCNAVLDASHVGDNLGNAIWAQSGNGAVIWGTLRDLDGNMDINEGFNILTRDFRPQSNERNMIMGINCPLQLGYVTVMPGDIVLARRDGIVFIPPQHAEGLVRSSERTRLQDTFAHIGVREGRFTAQQADGGFTPAMNTEYTQWLKTNRTNMGKFFKDPKEAPSVAVIDEIIKSREGAAAPQQ